MGGIINLALRDKEVLSDVTDERLDGQYLADGPLSSYVDPNEQVAFVLTNKRSGVTIEGDDGTETYTPGRPYRTLVAITDVRILAVVGDATPDGDHVVSVPLSDITDVTTEGGLFGSGISVTTDAGDVWSVPCKGDLDPVVSYLEAAQQAWALADRFLSGIEQRIDTARYNLDSGEHETALDVAEDAASVRADCLERLRGIEMGEEVVAHTDFDSLSTEIRLLQRRAHAGVAADNREAATDHRDESRLREAHDSLLAARQEYEQALTIDAAQPSDEEIQDSISEITEDITTLERVPAKIAAGALDAARAIDNPHRRAEQLAVALDHYRDWLELSWGPTAPFEGDTDEIQAQILEIVDELVAARTDAIRRLLAAADRLQVRDRQSEALAECDRAADHLAEARAVVTELAPDRMEVIEMWEAVIDDQVTRIEGKETPTTEQDTGSSRDDAETDATGSDDAETGEQPGENVVDARLDSMVAKLRTLDQTAFTRLVANCWRALGWQTTAFTESIDQYDVMATRKQPIELRVLVWAVHRPDGEIGTAVVDRCTTDRSNVKRADVAALVTTGTVPEDVRERARDNNVKLIDRSDFLDLLEREGLATLVDEATE